MEFKNQSNCSYPSYPAPIGLVDFDGYRHCSVRFQCTHVGDWAVRHAYGGAVDPRWKLRRLCRMENMNGTEY
jgi:hypothetical protein